MYAVWMWKRDNRAKLFGRLDQVLPREDMIILRLLVTFKQIV